MIQVKKNEQGEYRLQMKGSIEQVTAECIMVMREIYKRNLIQFPEPQIALGILLNMCIQAIDKNKMIETIGARLKQGLNLQKKQGVS